MRPMILAALSLALVVGASGCDRVEDEVFGARVRTYLLENPEVIEEAVMRLEEKKMAEAEQASSTAIATRRNAIERDRRDYVANPNGKITVTEFFDYRCGYCRTAAPEIIKLIAANPDVRFVFKEFPIFGGLSDEVASLALAANRQGKYLSLHQSLFSVNSLNAETVDHAISQAGLNPATLKAAAKDEQIARHLADNQRLARELRIDGTPTFIIGDTMVQGADFEAINRAIDRARRAA